MKSTRKRIKKDQEDLEKKLDNLVYSIDTDNGKKGEKINGDLRSLVECMLKTEKILVMIKEKDGFYPSDLVEEINKDFSEIKSKCKSKIKDQELEDLCLLQEKVSKQEII